MADSESLSTHGYSAGGPNRPMEIAHVLFMDIVAYSKLSIELQTRRVNGLQNVVRTTRAYAGAQERQQLLSLPTGDGMALVFFDDPEAPAICAIEIAKLLHEHPEVKLRMGINTGPVLRVEDINEKTETSQAAESTSRNA